MKKKSRYVIILILFLGASSCPLLKAADKDTFSLFYNDDELKERAVKIEKNIKPQHLNKIHLKALLYSDSQTWTLWINDHKIDSNEPHSSYKIQHITSEYVILDWTYQGKTHRVQLRPNQSYDTASDQISEGM